MPPIHAVRRNFKQYIILTILFTLVAGMVNAYGLIILGTFTTNLTGHVGNMARNIENENYLRSTEIIVWIGTFLFGAFLSSLLTNLLDKRHGKFSYITPVTIEILCLSAFVILYDDLPTRQLIDFRVLLLLLAMGIQNGIISYISGNVVRTTHITGMITDVGIGLGDLITEKHKTHRMQKKVIISGLVVIFFLGGGLFAAFTYNIIKNFMLIPIGVLIILLIYDFFMQFSRKEKKKEAD